MKNALVSAVAGLSLLLSGSAMAQETIKIAYTGPDSLLAFVALDQNYFADEGLNVELERVAINNNIVPALVSGSVQIGTISSPSFLRAVEADLDLVAFSPASLYKSSDTGHFGLVARKDAGLSKPEDLVGKKVGNPGIGGVLDILFHRWMQTNNVDQSRVQSVELAFPNLTDAITSGQLQVSVSTDPFLSRMTADGNAVLFADFASEIPQDTAAIVFATTREWSDSHPGVVQKLQNALGKAAQLVTDTPDARLQPVIKYTNLPEAAARSSLGINVGGGPLTAEEMAFWVDAMTEQGTLQNVTSVDAYLAQ